MKNSFEAADPDSVTDVDGGSQSAADRRISLSRRQSLEQAVHNNPVNAVVYLELADLHLDEGREFDAERVLTKALTNVVEDKLLVLEKLEDVKMLRSRQRLTLAEELAEKEKTENAIKELERTRLAHDRLEFEICSARCERDPNNVSLRYELGVRLKRTGDYQQALEHLREVLDDPQLRPRAHLETGDCLGFIEEYPKALQSYRFAADAATELQQPEIEKLALYRAGTMAKNIRLVTSAERYFSALLQLDPNYEDAVVLLEEVKTMDEIG